MSESGKSHSQSFQNSSHKKKPKIRRVSADIEDSQTKARRLIQQSYIQLDQMINFLDEKIKKKIDTNNAKMLYAFQTHFNRVTYELKLLKERAQKNEEKFSTDKAIITLTKQCALFRQQAMRLSNELQDTFDQINVYKRKTDLLERQINIMNQSLADKTKKIKHLQAQKINLNDKLRQKQELLLNNNQIKNINQAIDCRQYQDSQIYRNTKNNSEIQLMLQARKYDGNASRQILITDLSPESHNKKIIRKLINHRPGTTQAKCKKRQISQLTIYDPSNFNQTSIFSNQKILNIRNSNKNGSPQKKQNSESKTKTRLKTNYSVGSHTYSNILIDQIRSNNTIQKTIDPKLIESGVSQQVKKQLYLFYDFLNLVNKTRQNVLLNGHRQIMSTYSNEAYQFIFNQSSLFKLFKAVFTNLQVSTESTITGTKYNAKPKNNTKTLAQLSSQLMKRLQRKKNSKQNNRKKDRNFTQIESQNTITDQFDTFRSQQKQHLQDQREQNNEARQFDTPSKQHLTQKKQKSIKKVNDYFSKKVFTRKERQTNYKPYILSSRK